MKPVLLSSKCVQAEGEDAVISEMYLLLDCFLRVLYFMELLPLFIRIVTVNMIWEESKNIILNLRFW